MTRDAKTDDRINYWLHELGNALSALALVAEFGEPEERDGVERAVEIMHKLRAECASSATNGWHGKLMTPGEVMDSMSEASTGALFKVYIHKEEIAPSYLSRQVMWYEDASRAIGEQLARNWAAAGATVIHVVMYVSDGHLVIAAIDNGCGMSAAQLDQVVTGKIPFRDEHGHGTGIIKRISAQTGRTVSWKSIQYAGTQVTFRHKLVEAITPAPESPCC